MARCPVFAVDLIAASHAILAEVDVIAVRERASGSGGQ